MKPLLTNINMLYNTKKYINAIINISTPKDAGQYPLPPGIYGGSNTCFHNAATQLFYRMEELIPFIINPLIKKQYIEDSHITHFIDLIKQMYNRANNNDNNSYTDYNIMDNICTIVEDYIKKRQDDAKVLLVNIFYQLITTCTHNMALSVNKDKICKPIILNNQQITRQQFDFPPTDPRTFFCVWYEIYKCDTGRILSESKYLKKYEELYKHIKTI